MKKTILFILTSCFLFCGSNRLKADTVQNDSLNLKSEQVLNYLIQGKGVELNALLRTDLKNQLPATVLNSLFNQLEMQCGKLQRQGMWQTTTTGGTLLYYKDLQFEQAPLRIILGYEKDGSLNTLRVAPGQAVPDKSPSNRASAGKEKNITVVTGSYHLPGLLTLPEGYGPFPVVVLVHGSGPMDKDETVGPHKVFRDIADGLAKRGIATIRYDKRTFVSGEPVKDLNEESVDDAVSAIQLAAGQTGIDTGRIFVLGHSQGGRLLPRIVQKAGGKVKGCIGLAASARSVQEVLPEQIDYLKKVAPRSIGDMVPSADVLLKELPSSYRKDDKNYNAPAEAAKSQTVYCFLQGGKDYNVTEKDFGLWKKALPGAQFQWYPDLNHLFRKTEGTPSPEELVKPGTFSEDALQAIADFINKGKIN